MLRARAERLQGIALALLVLAILIVFNLGSWYFYSLARQTLQQEIQERVRTVCKATARDLSLLDLSGFAQDAPKGTLYGIVRDTFVSWETTEPDIAGFYLLDELDRVILSSIPEAVEGEPYPFAELDRTAILAARTGLFVSTSVHSWRSLLFLNAYGPVGEEGLVLGVKADVRYGEIFESIRSGILVANVLSGALALLFAGLYFRVGRRIARTEEALFEQEKLATLGQLAAGVAHEIRNPLGIMKQAVALLRRQSLPEESREWTVHLEESVNRINRLVEDVLSYTRRERLQRTPGNLEQTVEQSLSLLNHRLRRDSVTVEKELKATRTVAFDPHRISQVVMNLVLNAIEAMPEGGTVRIRTRDTPDGIELTVEDSGPGISPEIVERIWEPFFTRREHGTGLGLAIVRKIVEDHGGEVRVWSTPGEGSTFTVHLPDRPASQENAP